MNNLKEVKHVVYEYKTMEVRSGDVVMLVDSYESFGYELISKTKNRLTNKTIMSLKRNKELKADVKLNTYEKEFNMILRNIQELEKEKHNSGVIFSLIFGIISVLILGGGMSLVLLNDNNLTYYLIGTLIGIIGIALIAINYPIFKMINKRKFVSIQPKIEERLDDLSNVVLEAHKYLAKS